MASNGKLEEIEQAFLLNRSVGNRNLEEVLQDQVARKDSGWTHQRIEQGIIDYDKITKTRIRMIRDGDGPATLLVTFKGPNKSEKGAPKPRFELDLPIDLKKLAEMHPGKNFNFHDALEELFSEGSLGIIRKDRYTYKGDPKRTFDVDLYDWTENDLNKATQSEGFCEKLELRPKQVQKLYSNLSLADVELTNTNHIVSELEHFPEPMQEFVAHTDDGKLHEITGNSLYKGRLLNMLAGRAGICSPSKPMVKAIEKAANEERHR